MLLLAVPALRLILLGRENHSAGEEAR